MRTLITDALPLSSFLSLELACNNSDSGKHLSFTLLKRVAKNLRHTYNLAEHEVVLTEELGQVFLSALP